MWFLFTSLTEKTKKKRENFPKEISLLCFIFCFLPVKIWQASDCIPFQSASTCCWPERHKQKGKPDYLRWRTCTDILPLTSVAWHFVCMPITKQLGALPIPTPFCGSQKNPRACLWSRASYSSLEREGGGKGRRIALLLPIIKKNIKASVDFFF